MRVPLRPVILPAAVFALFSALAPAAGANERPGFPLQTIDVHGRAVGPGARGLPGVRVSLEGMPEVSMTTDEDGSYALTVPIGRLGDPVKSTVTIRVVAVRPGWAFTLRNGQGALAIELRMQTRTVPPRCLVRSNLHVPMDAVTAAIARGERSTKITHVDFVGEEGAPPTSRVSLSSQAVTIVGKAKPAPVASAGEPKPNGKAPAAGGEPKPPAPVAAGAAKPPSPVMGESNPPAPVAAGEPKPPAPVAAQTPPDGTAPPVVGESPPASAAVRAAMKPEPGSAVAEASPDRSAPAAEAKPVTSSVEAQNRAAPPRPRVRERGATDRAAAPAVDAGRRSEATEPVQDVPPPQPAGEADAPIVPQADPPAGDSGIVPVSSPAEARDRNAPRPRIMGTTDAPLVPQRERPSSRPRIRRIEAQRAREAASTRPDAGTTKLPGPGVTQNDASLIRRFDSASGSAETSNGRLRAEEVLAEEGDCACRIRGTIEMHPDHLLTKRLDLTVTLGEAPAVRDTIQLFMGSPRPFELAPVRCGRWSVLIDAVTRRDFRIVSIDGLDPVDCRDGGLRQLRIVLDPN